MTEGAALDRALGRSKSHLLDIVALFPAPAELSSAAWHKVGEEWGELLDETWSLEPDIDHMGAEVADLLVAIVIWARARGLDLPRHLDEKSRVVAERPIERRGHTWHHVKEDFE